MLRRAGVKPAARFVVCHAYDSDGTTNLPLEHFLAEDALLADTHDEQPITAEHGVPVRGMIPQLYAWKSAKWIKAIELVAEDQPGFWEHRGYHRRGDPWTEERHGEGWRIYHEDNGGNWLETACAGSPRGLQLQRARSALVGCGTQLGKRGEPAVREPGMASVRRSGGHEQSGNPARRNSRTAQDLHINKLRWARSLPSTTLANPPTQPPSRTTQGRSTRTLHWQPQFADRCGTERVAPCANDRETRRAIMAAENTHMGEPSGVAQAAPTDAQESRNEDSSTRRREGVVSDPDSGPPSAGGATKRLDGAGDKLRDVMTRNVEALQPDNTLEEAAKKMQEFGVGQMPVCIGDVVVGVITDRDIIERSVARGEDPSQDRVRDVMTSEVTCCLEDQSVADAERLMQEKDIHQLPVLDHEKHLVGIVTRRDLAGKAGEMREIGR